MSGGRRRLGVGRCLIDGRLERADLELADGEIVAVVAPRPGASGIGAPGFVDLQVNGFAGVDFATASADDLLVVAEAVARSGVTAFLPTVITAPLEMLTRAVTTVGQARKRQAGSTEEPARRSGARILGAHVEGPFLSPHRLGAHPPDHRREPDTAAAEELLAAGPVRLVTLAPERPGALELIARLRSAGVTVALGHTDATAAETRAGLDAGATLTTHHGNAMRPFAHRDPGVFGAALADDRCLIPLIVDGHHLAPETVRLIAGAADDRLMLVTDAVAVAGLGADTPSTTLGGGAVSLVGGMALRPDGTLAGSALTMDQAVRNLVDLGIHPARALQAASTTPASALSPQRRCELGPGAPAELVVLDDDLAVRRTHLGSTVASGPIPG